MQYTDAVLFRLRAYALRRDWLSPLRGSDIFSIYRGLGASRLAFARMLRPHGSSADALLPPASVLTPLPGLIFRSLALANNRQIPIWRFVKAIFFNCLINNTL